MVTLKAMLVHALEFSRAEMARRTRNAGPPLRGSDDRAPGQSRELDPDHASVHCSSLADARPRGNRIIRCLKRFVIRKVYHLVNNRLNCVDAVLTTIGASRKDLPLSRGGALSFLFAAPIVSQMLPGATESVQRVCSRVVTQRVCSRVVTQNR